MRPYTPEEKAYSDGRETGFRSGFEHGREYPTSFPWKMRRLIVVRDEAQAEALKNIVKFDTQILFPWTGTAGIGDFEQIIVLPFEPPPRFDEWIDCCIRTRLKPDSPPIVFLDAL